MTKDEDLAQFAGELNAEVLNRAGEESVISESKEAVLTELILEHLSEAGVVENPTTSYFEGRIGRGIGRANGYSVGEDEDSLDIFITVYFDEIGLTKLPPEEIRKAIEQAVRFADAALKGLHKTMDSDVEAFSMTSRIATLKQKLRIIRILVLSNGIATTPGKFPDRETDNIKWKFEVWDIQRLSRLLQSGVPLDEIDVNLEVIWSKPIPCVSMPATSEYQAHLTILPGELLFRLYEEFGARLMERNVRSFLQAKGKVNKGIRDTLRTEPKRFMAYNNGISITANEVEIKSPPGGTPCITRIRNLQIVNGGQTTASIHRARKTDKADLSGVFIPAKISVISNELLDTLAPKIAEFANTQNPVQMADFSANDPFHIELERLSKAIWMPGEEGKWFYERARGQYAVAQTNEGTTAAKLRKFKQRTPPSRKFSKIDMAKFLNSWEQRPHMVSQGGQANFVMFTQHLRESRIKGWLPDESFFKDLIAKAILFMEAVRVVRSESFPAYRANIVTYLVAYLAHRSGGRLDLKYLWDNQKPSLAMEALMRKWSHPIAEGIVESAGARNVTQWAKKLECWKAIMALDLPFPELTPPELQVTVIEHKGWGIKPNEVRVAVDPDDMDAIAQCRAVDIADWIRILDWGRQTGALDQADQQVASALAALSASGWPKEPSVKHAKEGRRIINMADAQGALAESN